MLRVARWNLKPTYFTHIAKTCTCTYIIYLMYLHLYTGPNMWVMVPNHLANLKTLKVIAKHNLVSWHGSLAETRKKMPSNVLVVDWRINQPMINFFAVLIHHLVAADCTYLLSIGSKIKHNEQIETWIHSLIYTWTISSKTPTYATCKTL